ncbi:N-formylglutamate amidohydrolase [Tranquillimonas rosea]|uniref:N-formylglutamate amidohydrolase n=1 Tax=Tranquillimonas rosea TaxID=641238 RepID=UPI003BAA0973
MMPQPYQLFLPARRATSVVFDSPHSGRDYPAALMARSVLDARSIRSSEDAFVDDLFAPALDFGAPLLAALAPRAFIDLNRAEDELDPALIEGVARGPINPRISSGLGVVPRVVANGRAIYRGKMARAEAEARVREYWRPYHSALQELLDDTRAQFGEAILIDCHSMPHEAIEGLGGRTGRRPDVILGDRFGAAAAATVMDAVESAFLSAGLRVARNAPFAGAYITQRYGRPSRRQHVIQVEIDRALYMDEMRVRPSADFDGFRTALSDVISRICAIGAAELPLAAE